MVFSLLVLGSHYPSDVAGGILVSTGWACLSTAALRLELRPSVVGPALAATVLAAMGALVIVLRPSEAFAYAAANTTFVAGAAGALRRRGADQRKRPGSQSGSARPADAFTPRERMNSRSESRLR